MTIWTLARLALTLGSLSPLAAAAQDAAAGRMKAQQVCQTCHGLDGISRLPNAPHIAGAPEVYFVAQLEAYRSGERRNEMMSVIAQGLTDAEIANLAAYYGAIQVSVKIP